MSDMYYYTPALPAFAAPIGGGQVPPSLGQGIPDSLPQKGPPKIAAKLPEFKERPNVSVSLKEGNSFFYVHGEVNKPGKFPLKSDATVVQGVSLAEGFTNFALKGTMVVRRTVTNGDEVLRQVRIPVPFDDLVSASAKIENVVLKSRETIVVP